MTIKTWITVPDVQHSLRSFSDIVNTKYLMYKVQVCLSLMEIFMVCAKLSMQAALDWGEVTNWGPVTGINIIYLSYMGFCSKLTWKVPTRSGRS